jgi:hypothetical protein
MKKLNTEIFIERATEKHGDKYGYSLVEYKTAHVKVKIICKYHGIFEQKAFKHLRGEGCGKCSGNIQSNTEEFIEKSKLIHGDKYDYSKVDYKNCKTKVVIICKEHDEFQQIPSSHLQGYGCGRCGSSKLYTTEEIVDRFKKIHADRYNYSKVDYTKYENKVIIICKKHGDFKQLVDTHLRGYGCSKCSGKYRNNNEEFILKAKKIHGDKYIYDKVDYKNAYTKVILNCKKHGDFLITPNRHTNEYGCIGCHGSKGELLIENFLIENNIKYKPQYSFTDLKYKRCLLFDFGLLDDNGNLVGLLEYNGIQHYEFVKHMHEDEDGFELYKFKDNLKKDYCEKNNIPLNIIRYDEDIESKLLKTLYSGG